MRRILPKKKAFTLAEVLITLTIIGVVAALTVPSLVKNFQETQFKNSFKKIYSDFSQASKLMVVENGGDLVNYFAGLGNSPPERYCSYLKCVKICKQGTLNPKGNCWHVDNSFYKLVGTGDSMSMNSGVILNNGALVGFYNDDVTCAKPENGINICNSIFVDVNGWKGPNTWGKDIFAFYTTGNGVHTGYGTSWNGTCLRTTHGYGCARNILQNIDY